MTNISSTEQDKALIFRMNDGDSLAFDEIFRKYYKPLTAYAFRYVVMEDAEEIVQNLLMWIWEKREDFSITTSLQSYLFHSVYYRCLSCIEQNSASRRLDDKIWENSFVDPNTPLDYFNIEELSKRINEALAKLPDEFREAFVMQRFHGKTYQEIAEELNVSNKVVAYRIQKATKLLREDLKDYLPGLLFLSISLMQ